MHFIETNHIWSIKIFGENNLVEEKSGARGGNRTPDQGLMSPLLYRWATLAQHKTEYAFWIQKMQVFLFIYLKLFHFISFSKFAEDPRGIYLDSRK